MIEEKNFVHTAVDSLIHSRPAPHNLHQTLIRALLEPADDFSSISEVSFACEKDEHRFVIR